MPSIKNKAAQGLSWDSFPEPPPEAETWVPDPGSIARPGRLIDPRFNKDPYEEARLRAARKEHGYHLHHSSEAVRIPPVTPSVNGTGTIDLNAGKWPLQVPRQTQPERSLSGMSSGSSVTKPVAAQNGDAGGHTMGNFAVKPASSHKPPSPVGLVAPPIESVTKKTLPVWAGPLEKALAEDTSKVPAFVGQAAVKSISPHLRKPGKAIIMSTEHLQSRSSDLQANSYQPAAFDIDAHYEAACEATRRASSSLTAVRSANDVDLLKHETLATNMMSFYDSTNDVEQNAKLRNTLADHDNKQCTAKASENGRYKDLGHYLKISLVLTMKKDLWEHELLKLDEKELERRMLSVSSDHEQYWEAKYGRSSPYQNGDRNNAFDK